ncbi:hypothetical protein NX801_04775 [Streptomyces sp. LP05-1]|uniref:Uncharacterized protein n=1 Tax=Streptomyces pyxinae TaxID=2970734 RepID=A0ABT2CC43_9ACTN|nr:hypothetical protein [Streptomyces sp. LP05-1]MCS0634983.1 hypothetical protein [Streptomyces sp. LP05-1]
MDWRDRAAADHQLVFGHIDRDGELSAQRLVTRAFVARVQRLAGLGTWSGGETSGVNLARVRAGSGPPGRPA